MSTIVICFMLIGCGFASGCLVTSAWYIGQEEREERRETRKLEKRIRRLDRD